MHETDEMGGFATGAGTEVNNTAPGQGGEDVAHQEGGEVLREDDAGEQAIERGGLGADAVGDTDA